MFWVSAVRLYLNAPHFNQLYLFQHHSEWLTFPYSNLATIPLKFYYWDCGTSNNDVWIKYTISLSVGTLITHTIKVYQMSVFQHVCSNPVRDSTWKLFFSVKEKTLQYCLSQNITGWEPLALTVKIYTLKPVLVGLIQVLQVLQLYTWWLKVATIFDWWIIFILRKSSTIVSDDSW